MEDLLTHDQKIMLLSRYLGQEGHLFLADESPDGYHTDIDLEVLLGYKNDPDERYVQVYLKPLSEISDEHFQLIQPLIEDVHKSFDQTLITLNILKNWKHKDYFLPHSIALQLINLGYDVPVFIDIDHPANGKTMMELGLALEVEV